MRVVVDCRGLNVGFVRGMGRYLAAMLNAADGLVDWEWELLSNRPDLPFERPVLRRSRQSIFDMKGYRFHTWEQLALPWRARRARADVLFCPNTTLPWWQPVPAVVTVHDTVPWESEEWSQGQHWYWHRLLPRALRKAAAVVVPSQSSKTDIARLWPHLAHKVEVIPHGLTEIWRHPPAPGLPEALARLGARQPYLLYVGGELPRKRLPFALRVFAELGEADCQLLVMGASEQSRARICRELPEDVARRVIVLPFVAEDDMPQLVAGAVAVLYPTLYEGFGFPAIEAQAMGTPILFSALGSLAELQGPGAVVLPAEDFSAWVETCRKLVAERRTAPVPNEAARAWALQFSWESSARRHLELLQQAARTSARE